MQDILPHIWRYSRVPAGTCLDCHRGFVRGIHDGLGKGLLLLARFTHSLHGCSSR